jgi:ligand-binding sensor domain-containing protein
MQKIVIMNKWDASGHIFRLVIIFLLLTLCLTSCAAGTGIFSEGKWQSGGLQHQQIRTLAVDPNNPQIIYAGDAQDGVFVSTNAGINWSQQDTGLILPIAINALVFDDAGKKLYAATDRGILVSADAAKHWSDVTGLPADNYTALAFDLNAPTYIYTATEHHGIFVTANDGSSWTAANRGLPTGILVNGLAFDFDQHQLWAATNLGIYRSSNAGMQWQALNTGLPPTIVVNTVLPAATSGGDQGLVFAGTNHGFFRSQDNGAQWLPSQESLYGTSVNAILIDYHKVTTVYAGTGIGVLRSDDNGQNWSGIASGLPRDQAVEALAIGANGYNQLYAATNGIYLFPGNNSAFDPSQIFPILLILAFFFALYRFTLRGRKRSQQMPKPERIFESKLSTPLDFSQTHELDEAHNDGRSPIGQEPDLSIESDKIDNKEENT